MRKAAAAHKETASAERVQQTQWQSHGAPCLYRDIQYNRMPDAKVTPSRHVRSHQRIGRGLARRRHIVAAAAAGAPQTAPALIARHCPEQQRPPMRAILEAAGQRCPAAAVDSPEGRRQTHDWGPRPRHSWPAASQRRRPWRGQAARAACRTPLQGTAQGWPHPEVLPQPLPAGPPGLTQHVAASHHIHACTYTPCTPCQASAIPAATACGGRYQTVACTPAHWRTLSCHSKGL